MKRSLVILSLLAVMSFAFGIYASAATSQTPSYSTYGPASKEIIMPIITDSDAQLLAIQKGDVGLMGDLIRSTDINALKADKNISLTFDLGYHMFYLSFNMRDGRPAGDKVLRRAVAMSINRDQFINSIYQGYVIPLSTFVLPSSPFYVEDVPVAEYDPEGAKALLDAAGYVMDAKSGRRINPKTGKPLEDIILLTPTAEAAPTSAELGKMVAQSAQAIGIPLKNEPTDFNTILDKIDTLTFDAYMLAWSFDRFPTLLWDLFHSSQAGPQLGNTPGIVNAELDKALDGLKYAKTYEDAFESAAVAQTILAEEQPYVPLYSRPYINAFRNDQVTGWVQMMGYGSQYYPNKWTTLNIRSTDPTKPVRWLMPEEPDSLNPLVADGAYAWQAIGMCMDGLIETDPATQQDIPWMAKSWEIGSWTTADGGTGTKITFHLQDGLKWSDGSPFTASDIKFTAEYLRDQKVPRFDPYVRDIAKVDAVDDKTAVFYFNNESYWHFYDVVSLPWIKESIWSGKVYDSFDPLATNAYVVTGPFVISEYKPGEYVKLSRNENYWRFRK